MNCGVHYPINCITLYRAKVFEAPVAAGCGSHLSRFPLKSKGRVTLRPRNKWARSLRNARNRYRTDAARGNPC